MLKFFKNLIYPLLFLLVLFGLSSKSVTKAVGTQNFPFGLAGPSTPDDPDKISQLGIKYAREGVTWYKIETSDGVWDFSFLDHPDEGIIGQLGLEIIPRIKFGNNFSTTNYSWAVKCDLSLCPAGATDCPDEQADCPPKDLATDWTGWTTESGYSPLLTDFVTTSLNAFFSHGKQFEYIVVGNETNLLKYWQGSAIEYLKTRATVYNATKRFNVAHGTSYKVVDGSASSTIYSNAIGYEAYCRGDVAYAVDFANRAADHTLARDITAADFSWLNCNDIGGRDYKILKAMFSKDPNLGEAAYDLLSYHFYEPWNVQEEVINWINQEMRNNGYTPKPIINTEGGYHDTLHLYADTPTLAQDVANDVPKLHTVAFQNGVKTWLWLPFTERPEGTSDSPWKGLVYQDQSLLPAFTSYKTMVAKMNGFASIEKISGLGTNFLYKINFPDKKPRYVIWDETGKTVDLSSLVAGTGLVTKVDGTSQTLATNNLVIGQSPLYLESLPEPTLTKTVDKAEARAGETLTYTLSYSNPTANNLSSVRLEDVLPAGTEFISADNNGAFNGTKVVWNLSGLPAGGTGTVSFQARILFSQKASITTGYTNYYLKEPVILNVKNAGSKPIALGDTFPWIIKDNNGQIAFDPGGIPSTDTLAPGSSASWRWDQKNNQGNFVPYGSYQIQFQPTGDSNSLQIDNKQGSEGYFTFNMLPNHDQEFRVFMTQPQSIRYAIDHYYGLKSPGLPIGNVVDDRPGKSPYDSRWSWHFDPQSLHVADGAIELCDGNPNWIESHLSDWAGKTFCPWSADLIGLN